MSRSTFVELLLQGSESINKILSYGSNIQESFGVIIFPPSIKHRGAIVVGLESKRTEMRSTISMTCKLLQPVILKLNNGTQTKFILLLIKRAGNGLVDTKLARHQIGLVGNDPHVFSDGLKANEEESGS